MISLFSPPEEGGCLLVHGNIGSGVSIWGSLRLGTKKGQGNFEERCMFVVLMNLSPLDLNGSK